MEIQNEQGVVSAKEQWTARMQEKHPDMDMNDEESVYSMLLHDDEEHGILQQWYDEMSDRTPTAEQRQQRLEQLSTEMAGECDEKVLADAVEWIGSRWEQMACGEMTADMLQMVMRGLTYDSAVAVARHEGEVEGRNSRIEQILDDRMQRGDTCADNSDERTCGWLPELGALNKAGRLSIWERGRERRQ